MEKMSQRSFRMELIKKESTRKHTFEKRKASLVKKVSEISILCGVEACLIIYAPKMGDEQAKLDTLWPSDSDQVRKIIDKYKKTNKAKRSYTVSDYFAEKKRKVDSEIAKLKKQINGAKYPCWDIRLDNFSLDELMALNSQLDRKIEAAGKKISLCRGNQRDLMLSLSENFGNYMNRKSNFEVHPFLKQLQNKVTLPVPACFQPGQNCIMNPLNSNLNSQVLPDSNPMILNRGKVIDQAEFKEADMSTQFGGWTTGNAPIWQCQNYVNTSPWNLNNCNNSDSNLGFSSLQFMLPQPVAPISSLPYQLPGATQPKYYSGPGLMDLAASSLWPNGPDPNH